MQHTQQATYLADRVVVYDGTPSIDTVAHSPESLLSGMNKFLEQLDITFRRDPTNYRQVNALSRHRHRHRHRRRRRRP